MATRPVNYPTFAATAAGTDIEQPDSSHQNAGWGFEEKPPYEYLNWLMKNYNDWVLWLDQEMNRSGAGWTSTAPTLASGPTGGEASYYMATHKRLTVKRLAVGPGFATGLGFGMVSFALDVELSGAEAYLTLDLPIGDTYGSYDPKAAIQAAGPFDSLIVTPIAARVATPGVGTALAAFACAARDADDSNKPKIFLGSAELMDRVAPSTDFWLSAGHYQISGDIIYPLNV